MSLRNLDRLFRPGSVAVIGASDRPGSVGTVVMRNLRQGGFAGSVMAVNPRHETLSGATCYPDIASLPGCPDLGVICTPAPTVPGLIRALGEKGTKAAVVITAGLSAPGAEQGKTLQQAMIDAARPHLLRIVGPNTVGLMIPGIGLNASFAHTGALPGRIAFVSQSGALATSILDWSKSRGIGFSHFVSLGNSADVDFGDTLDYLASDPQVGAMLLYIESIRQARKFMSAARAASRNMPVIVVKAGRMAEGARAAASHTGAMAGADDVYDAAIRRAGMLRVYTIDDLFNAVETLGRTRRVSGERLAILTNGGGSGVMAADALAADGGQLATLAPDTIRRLDEVLPANWSRGNPVDIVGDAPVSRYVDALTILLEDPGSDAVLFLHSPTAIVPAEDIAKGLAPLMKNSARGILTCWLGGESLRPARDIFTGAGIPTYDTPEGAVGAFLQIVHYRRNQAALMETPSYIPSAAAADREAVRGIVTKAVAARRDLLTEPEAKALLAHYGIPAVETRIAGTPDEAARVAAEIGFPVALKILSPDITHKSDIGGVALHLAAAAAVRTAAGDMLGRIGRERPDARIDGFTVQRMVSRPGAHELIAGTATDPVFGPVILFGQGGTAVEVVGDRAIALPPLNTTLARDLIARTRVAKLLAGYRNRPPADRDAIAQVLIGLSRLMIDFPEIAELDINPLLADDEGALALDARVRLASAGAAGADRLAIRPYPHELEEPLTFDGRPLTLRPIRPEDEPQHRAFFERLEPEDIRFRFFGALRTPTHATLARFTQIDYDREMALIATRRDDRGEPETLGVVRAVTDPDNLEADFSIVVRSDMKGRGLGTLLLGRIVAYCRARGTRRLIGQVLRDNSGMMRLSRDHGFAFSAAATPEMCALSLDLQSGE